MYLDSFFIHTNSYAPLEKYCTTKYYKIYSTTGDGNYMAEVFQCYLLRLLFFFFF